MEDELWKETYRLATRIGKGKGVVRGDYTDAWIVAVYFWSVVHDRPISWACVASSWRGRAIQEKLPSPATMSRRLRSEAVQQLIKAIEKELINISHPSICRLIDAKPLPISGHSEDPDAAYGRAASSMARGYKFHGIYDQSQGFVQWKIAPMNVNENPVAAELISKLTRPGYLVGDNAFDRNKLYDLAGKRDIQLIAPQRKDAASVGHQQHSPYRLKAIEMQTRSFARQLLWYRRTIETVFAQLTSLSFGLGPLPNWVRSIKRVENWVRAKLILFQIYRRKQSTCEI